MADLKGKHLLLLQGPAGPFFARVAAQLRAAGARVTKVNFNGGEDLYYRGPDVVRFRAALEAWPAFFAQLVEQRRVQAVLLFGDCRPVHRAAIERATLLGVEVYVFEEGYLRPDFVTLERSGVNGNSRMPRDPEVFRRVEPGPEGRHRAIKHAFLKSALHTIAYASAAALGKARYPHYAHHRDIRPVAQAGLWLRGAGRRAAHALRDRDFAERLASRRLQPYFFVPLQVHLDSQLSHCRYTSVREFIAEVVETFAGSAPADHALVLKLHPMDRPYSDYSADIERLTRQYALAGRLFYVDVINLPSALRGARGTVVINSTVGLSSLTHGTPVKCLGRAVYDLPGLTHQGTLADFFRDPGAVDRALYKGFRQWLLAHNQLNGSVWSRLHDDPSRFVG